MNDCVNRLRLAGVATIKGQRIEIWRCRKRDHCTEQDSGLQQRDGQPMPACATCPLYERIASPVEQVFTRIAEQKEWGNGESISGPGSSYDATAKIRAELPPLLRSLTSNVADAASVGFTLLDAPCGDHHWMSRVDLGEINYIGADIVESIVESNRTRFPGRRFERLDVITSPLPRADAVLVRDGTVHLPYYDIGRALQNIVASGARWLIATHFPGRTNHDIKLGAWRPLDLCATPFHLPPPRHVINEGCREGGGAYADKSLGVWAVEDIKTAVAKLNAAPKLSICLPVVKAYRDVWFTLQAIKLYHAECHNEIEVIVLDNDTKGKPDAPYPASEREHSAKIRRLCEEYTTQFPCRYVHHTKTMGTAAAKAAAIAEARGEAVLVMDSHILLPLGVLRRLIDWWDAYHDWNGLLHGPNLRDDIALPNGRPALMGTHHKPGFVDGNWGQWQVDDRVYDRSEAAFEIDIAACGLFSFRRADWLGFVPGEGYVPEEGTLQARYRVKGRKILCAPWLLWDHLYGHTETPAYLSNREHRLSYYIRSSVQTNEPPIAEIRRHFVEDLHVDADKVESLIAAEISAATGNRPDVGTDCPHRSQVTHFAQCEVGCIATRTAVPIHHCQLHESPCSPWRWEQTQAMPNCLGCNRTVSIGERPA